MKYLLSLLALSMMTMVNSQALKYSKVKVNTDSHGLQQLAELGLAVDHGEYKEGTFLISDFSDAEIQIMEQNGFQYDILIDDVQKFYVKRNAVSAPKNVTCATSGSGGYQTPVVPTNFYTNATYGGFLKYQDMLDQLDLMAAAYPNMITVKAPVSTYTTHEGRPIYHVKISNNASTTDDLTKPNVLYTAIHHAREPLSMAQTVFYMWYLLENYATSEEIQFLVDNTEMFFVPCLNPDGYLRNESTDPNGGGMHRKNMAPVGTSNPGVDLNRNYSYGWNTTGVSANPNNDTYPGSNAFSEPETQAMQWLSETYGFVSAFNAHTYGNTLLHPIGTTSAEFADHHDYFADLCSHMCMHNGYFPQKSSGLYPASGDSDDYQYKVDIGVNLKDTIFAMTPEIGSDFWPASSEVIPSCQDMVFPNLVLSHMAHRYLVVSDTDPSTVATMTGNFNHDAQRLGTVDGAVTVSITPLVNVQSVGGPVVYDLDMRESSSGSISYVLDPAIAFGDEIKYILNTEYGLWTNRDTITKTFGALTLQYFEDGTNNTNWIGNWNTTTAEFYSPSSSFTDSPGGNYNNDSFRTYEFNQDIDLTTATAAAATFYAKWDIEADYDYCQFQVSTNGGATWIGQCGNYTVDGSSTAWNGSVQPDGEPVYEGIYDWVFEEISLSDYLGQTIRVRFVMEADGGVAEDGFYFDDFSISYNDASAPTTPTANFTMSTSAICEGGQVSFSDMSTGAPDTWAWDFGDGSNSTMQSPNHTFTSEGVYTVTLTSSNSAGSDTFTQSITVGAPSSSSQSLNICQGESVTVGSSTYTSAGTFTDVLANSTGCDSIVTTTISVDPLPTVALTVAQDTLCNYNDPIQLVGNPVGGTFSGFGMSGDTFDPSASGNGTHVITYTYADATTGCEANDQATIVVWACLGIDGDEQITILMYPNPSTGVFNVSGLELGTEYKVLSESGQVVAEGKTNALEATIDLSKMSSGKYFLTTQVNGENITMELLLAK
jgi:PKD repeat protein